MTELTDWLSDQIEPFTLDPDDQLPRMAIGRASIVGVGLVARSARELVLASHAVLRALVTDSGFRAVSLEGADATGARLDRYVAHGDGDPRSLVSASQSFLRMTETLELIGWLRNYAVSHPDNPVRVVHDTAPGDAPSSLEEIEQMLARRDLAWHERTGQRIVHLGGIAHMIVGDPRLVSPGPDQTHRNAGARLRAALGADYTAMAFTLGSGNIPFPVPPAATTAEAAFATLPSNRFVLDLHHDPDPPPAAAAWLQRPLRMRCIGPHYDPTRDSGAYVAAGPLHDSLDALVHVSQAGATTMLPQPRQPLA